MRKRKKTPLNVFLAITLSFTIGVAHAQTDPEPYPGEGTGIAVPGLSPTGSVENSKQFMQYYPGTEKLDGFDEMRITFMGSSPLPRIGQSGMSILVELGDKERYIFDMGPGSIHNYLAMGFSFPEINDIFVSHLHVDHWLDILYTIPFGAWGGRYEALRIYGPSGREQQDGIGHWATHLEQAMKWHIDAFNVVPIGEGMDMVVQRLDHGRGVTEGAATGNIVEFPWFPDTTTDDGVCTFYAPAESADLTSYCGQVYENTDGTVKISYWPASHAKDGAVSYRLDWETPSGHKLSFAYTGDSRPTEPMREFAQGVDVLVSECQAESLQVSAQSWGFPVELSMFTVDTHHTPAFAAGELFERTDTRVGVCSHITWDHNLINEVAAEVRQNFPDGLFLWGAPDRVVLNVDKDNIWHRMAAVPEYASQPAAQYDEPLDCVPTPAFHRAQLQCKALRENEVETSKYYTVDGTDRGLVVEFPDPLQLPPPLHELDYCDGSPYQGVDKEEDTCVEETIKLPSSARQGGDPSSR